MAAEALVSLEEAPAEQQLAAQAEESDRFVCERCHRDLPKAELCDTCGTKNTCLGCRGILVMINKHCGSATEFLDLLDPESQTDFFAKTLEEKKAGEGTLRYKNLRATFVSQLASRTVKTWTNAVNGDFLPLSVWEKRGFDTKEIEAKAPMRTHEILGATYRVDLFSQNFAHATSEAEEKVLNMEMKVQKKRAESAASSAKSGKGKGRKGKASVLEDENEAPPLSEEQLAEKRKLEQLVDLETDSEVEIASRLVSLFTDCNDQRVWFVFFWVEAFLYPFLCIAQVFPKRARGKGSGEKEAARAEKKAQADAAKQKDKDHKAVAALCGRVLSSLQPMAIKFNKLMEKAETNKDRLPAITWEKVNTCQEKLSTWLPECLGVLKKVGSGETVSWDDVSFTHEALVNAHVKECNTTIRAVNAALKKAK
jgi:RNA polymerase subunit RPABC4/transcription elongation factor Spt4